MIISASRRTDIPAFYSDWFINRLKDGYVVVPNPFDPKNCSRIVINPRVVDCIVFWTKNPAPLLNKLDHLKNYKYYFQFTLNPYDDDIEQNIPLLSKRIETFKKLSDKIGRGKVIWRYDPIVTNRKYNIQFHHDFFSKIISLLKDYTGRCMIGPVFHYKKISKILENNNVKPLEYEEAKCITKRFVQLGNSNNVEIGTCTELIDLTSFGAKKLACIDKLFIENITGYSIDEKKDKNQRPECKCMESIDIGIYGTCLHGCIYCYANTTKNKIDLNVKLHDKSSPKLIGNITDSDNITDRKIKINGEKQRKLF